MSENTTESDGARPNREEQHSDELVIVDKQGIVIERGHSDMEQANAKSDVWDEHRPYSAPHGVEAR